MIFTKDVTLLKNTSLASYQHDSLIICRGIIYRVEFQFPAGCAGLAYLAVFDGGHQIYPSNLGTFFHTDNFTISFDDIYLKLAAPYQLDFYGYNEDTLYDHTVFFRVGIEDREEFMTRFSPSMAYADYQKMIEKEAAKQEETKVKLLSNPFPWIQKTRR